MTNQQATPVIVRAGRDTFAIVRTSDGWGVLISERGQRVAVTDMDGTPLDDDPDVAVVADTADVPLGRST